MLKLQLGQLSCQRCLPLHCFNELCTGQVMPGSGNHSCLSVMLPQQRNSGIQLSLRNRISPGQNDGGCSFHLVVVELAKVLHIKLDLTGIGNSHSVTKLYVMPGHLLNSADHVGQLAHTRGFDDDPVGVILGDDLLQSLAKVTNQAAADAAGIHLCNVNASLLQETAVDADFTEFVLDQHQFLALVAFRNHFLDQRCLTSSEKTRVNINFCHKSTFCT